MPRDSIIDKHRERKKIIALLLDSTPLRDIAAVVSPKVSIMALSRYKRDHVAPVMQKAQDLAAVTRNVTAEALMAAPVLAVRDERLRELQDRHNRLKTVRDERAEDMPDVPGGKSGLLVRQYKSVGSGLAARVVEEYKLDDGLLAEFREHEKQAAIELGQWQDGAVAPAGTVNNFFIAMSAPPAPAQPGPVVDALPSK